MIFPAPHSCPPQQILNTKLGAFYENVCVHPIASPEVATIYFFGFVLLSAFMILSLFIGAVCRGMAEALTMFEEEENKMKIAEKKRRARAANPE